MNVKWSNLRGIGNLPIMRVTLIGPFLPYIFQLIDALARAEGLEMVFGPLVTGWPKPSLVSLHFFYFGATSLGLASAAYLVWCPTVIKSHVDFISYIEREAMIRSTTEKVPEDQVQMQLRNEYERADISHPAFRKSVFLLYVVGFVLLFLPPVYRFWEVLIAVLENIHDWF